MMYDVLILGMPETACAAAWIAARRCLRVGIVDCPTVADPCALEWVTDIPGRLDELSLAFVDVNSRTAGSPPRMLDVARIWSELSEGVTQRRANRVADLSCQGVDCLSGSVRFANSHQVLVEDRGISTALTADRIVIATGIRSDRPGHLPFDGRRLLTMEDVPNLNQIPQNVAVVVDDPSGLESVRLFCLLGSRVTVVGEAVEEISSGAIQRLEHHLGSAGATPPMWCRSSAVLSVEYDEGARVALILSDGSRIEQDAAVYCGRVTGNTDTLNLSSAGLESDDRGQLWCNEQFQTWVPHIYGLGEVIGYPSAAASLPDGPSAFIDALLAGGPACATRGVGAIPSESLLACGV